MTGLSVAFGCVGPQAFPPPPAPECALVGLWGGHFVLARENAAVVHYTRPEFACSGRGNDLGNVKHLFPVGELLVEVATDGQVRWSRARSVCALPPA